MKPNPPAAGFSLIEVMCAILILGIGVAGLTQGITTALQSNKESEIQTNAALLAAGRIELLRAEGYIIDGEDQGEGSGSFARYRWRQRVGGSGIDGLHEIEVAVEDTDTGKTIYELRTLLFDPPITSNLDNGTNRRDSSASRNRERRRR